MFAICPAGDEPRNLGRHGSSGATDWRDRIVSAVGESQSTKGRRRGASVERRLPVGDEVHALLNVPNSYTYCAWCYESQSDLADILLSKLARARQTESIAGGTVTGPGASHTSLTWRRWPATVGDGALPSAGRTPERTAGALGKDAESPPQEYTRLTMPMGRHVTGSMQEVRDHYERLKVEGQRRIVMWDSWGTGGYTFDDLGVTTVARRPGHRSRGCNMLFYDSHVEFVPFGKRIAYAAGPEPTYGAHLGDAMALASGSFVPASRPGPER